MFDGIKIECNKTDPAKWLQDERLLFPLSINENTGETIEQTRVSKYNGLIFKITPSRKYPGLQYCQLEGSLHKYFNEGRHNANDFHFTELTTIVTELSEQFDITGNSKLSNIEFGVNITLPMPVHKFLKMVVSMPDRKFTQLNIEKQKVGKVCAKQDHHFKIYDKGLQANSMKNNLLRVELAVKKMRILKPYGIETMQDLTNPVKVAGLGKYIARLFSEVIIIDPAIKKNTLTKQQQNKLKDYDNPRYWERLTKGQRYKQKQKYESLLACINGLQIKTTITNAIIKKWETLLNVQLKRGDLFTGLKYIMQPIEGVTFSPLECTVKRSPFAGSETEGNRVLKKRVRNNTIFAGQRVCKICGHNITHQKAGSLYCSKKCANKASGKFRMDRIKLKRHFEAKYLNLLKRKKERDKIKICRLTDTAGKVTACILDEIIMNPAEIRRVTKIEFTGTKAPAEVTTVRAKQFIRYVTNMNLTTKSKNHEKGKGITGV